MERADVTAGVRIVDIEDRTDQDLVLVVDTYALWRRPNEMSTPAPAPNRAWRLKVDRGAVPEGLHVGQDLRVRASARGSSWWVDAITALKSI